MRQIDVLKMRYAYIFFLVFSFSAPQVFAQKTGNIKVAYDTARTPTASDELDVILHADPRLDIITKKHKEMVSGGTAGYSGPGYRVQIYSGNDRNKAEKIRTEFMHSFPSIRTYLFYVQPQFRVKVGDFRTRGDAQKMYDQAHGICSPCMIVPDYVSILATNNQPKK